MSSVEFYAISLDCLQCSFTLFPMKMNFSFGLMVWIVRNLCIMLETWVIHPELIHHVSWETTVKFDSKHTWALSSPFFSNQDLHFRQSFWKCLNFTKLTIIALWYLSSGFAKSRHCSLMTLCLYHASS